MTEVLFRQAEYDETLLKPTVYAMMDTLAGGRIRSGDRVLIKPNLLLPARPETGIITHPLVVKVVAEYVLAAGGRVRISDSCASGSFKRVLKEGRYTDVLKGLPVELAPFTDQVQKDIGPPFGRIDIAKDPFCADLVINIAKLKTHSQMLVTLGVKNMFGCIVGLRKPEWHMRTGVDRDLFASLLVGIYRAVRPGVTLIDGIIALEGQGPGKRGVPRHLGILVGSRDAVSADAAVCRMIGIDPGMSPTHQAAKRLGLVEEPPSLRGPVPRVEGFSLPVPAPLLFGPKRFQKLMRKHLIQRPVVDADRCKRCGECWQYCPARAIDPGDRMIEFDYEKCIRCYCCIEVCPHGALRPVETLAGRILRGISLRRR